MGIEIQSPMDVLASTSAGKMVIRLPNSLVISTIIAIASASREADSKILGASCVIDPHLSHSENVGLVYVYAGGARNPRLGLRELDI